MYVERRHLVYLGVCWVLVLTVALSLIGGCRSQVQNGAFRSDEIIARRIALVDDEGQPRIQMIADSPERVSIGLLDPKGNPRIVLDLSSTGRAGISPLGMEDNPLAMLASDGETAVLGLFNPDHTPVAALGSLVPGAPQRTLNGEGGRLRLGFRPDSGVAGLEQYGEDNRPIVLLGEFDDGTSGLKIVGSETGTIGKWVLDSQGEWLLEAFKSGQRQSLHSE